MLARFEDASGLSPRRVKKASESVGAIQEQEKVLASAVRRRELAQRQLARHLRLPENAGLTDITPLLPPQYPPLVLALIAENTQLAERVRAQLHVQCGGRSRTSPHLSAGRCLAA